MKYFRLAVTLTTLLFAAQTARADSLTFTVMPTNVSGPAGTTVGWGFSITNTSSCDSTSCDYLDISGIDSDLFSSANGTPDASIFTFPNLAPGGTANQPYDPANGNGLFQFTWNSGVAQGTTESGEFRLMGAFCPESDPFCAEDGDVASTLLASGNYSATVTPAGSTTVPEPSSILLLLSGLCGIGFWRCQRKCEIRTASRVCSPRATTSDFPSGDSAKRMML